MSDIPIVGWIIISAIIATIVFIVISKFREAGAKKGLSFFASLPFMLFIIAIIGGLIGVGAEWQKEGVDFYNPSVQQNLYWSILFFSGSFVIGIFINGLSSGSWIFSVFFTFVQAITSLIAVSLSVIFIALAFMYLNNKKKESSS